MAVVSPLERAMGKLYLGYVNYGFIRILAEDSRADLRKNSILSRVMTWELLSCPNCPPASPVVISFMGMPAKGKFRSGMVQVERKLSYFEYIIRDIYALRSFLQSSLEPEILRG